MKGLGSGDNGEFTFLDFLAIASFYIGLQNLDLNLTQDDKQDLQNDLAEKTDSLLSEIHGHLTNQDKMLKRLEERLDVIDTTHRRSDS
jgi:hypothetical protein